jgi:hypothetical protein
MDLAMSYWPRRYSNDSEDRERIPSGAKKPCRDGRCSPGTSGGGRTVIGVVADKAKKWQSSPVSIIDRVAAVF